MVHSTPAVTACVFDAEHPQHAKSSEKRIGMQGSACFLIGVVLILIKWALVGICIETYGFWLLFSGFFPTVLGFLRRLPVLGSVLDLPVLKTVRVLIHNNP